MSDAEERDHPDNAVVVEGTDKVNATESGAESPGERDDVDASDLSDTGVGEPNTFEPEEAGHVAD